MKTPPSFCFRLPPIGDGCLRLVLLVLVLAVLGGCAAPPKKTAKIPPEAKPPTEETLQAPEKAATPGPAASLYNQAEQALKAGRAGEAEILLTRALRLEPRNPLYWYTLARAKFNQRQYTETVQFCRKVEALLGKGQGALASRNKALLAQAGIAGKSP